MIVLLPLLVLSPFAWAADVSVGASGADYSSIQDAIDASVSGDTLWVAPGVYTEAIDFSGKDLSIEGTGGAAATMLMGTEGVETVRSFGGEGGEFTGFTVLAPEDTSCALLIMSNLLLRDVLFEDCGAPGHSGGGAVQVQGGSPTLDAVTFSGSQSSRGGAILIEDGANVSLTNSVFEDNQATDGGCIDIHDSSLSISECTLIRCRAAFGDGGAIRANDATLTIESSDFSINEATFDGGGIWLTGGSISISAESDLNDNIATYGSGGALAVYGADAVDVANSEIARNEAGTHGGAVALGGTVWDAQLRELALFDNTAAMNGGGLYLGGGNYTVSGTSISGNRSGASGGGLWNDGATTLTLSEVDVVNNEAGTQGGGLGADHASSVNVTDGTISENRADESGGGAWLSANELVLSSLTISDNMSISGTGGGVWMSTARGVFSELTVTNNYARYGGGLAFETEGIGDLSYSLLQENTAQFDGGGLLLEGTGEATVWNSNLLGNQTESSGLAAGTRIDGPSVVWGNTILAHSLAGPAMVAAGASIDTIDVRYSLVWANDDGDFAGGLADPTGTDGNLRANPLFVELSLDETFTNDTLELLESSPCIAAGDPDVLTPEGSPSNIGAYGVGISPPPDLDGDGFREDVDCNDDDVTIYPGAPEVCADGVDNNCNGDIDEGCIEDTGEPDTGEPDTFDQDDTGTPNTGETGTPEPEDTGEDGREFDTGSSDPVTTDLYGIKGEGCSCHVSSAAPSADRLAWLLFGLLVWVRRRA